MDPEELVKNVADRVRPRCIHDRTAHDWPHIERVRTAALRIARTIGADPFVTELGALLHDIADFKQTGDPTSGGREARVILDGLGADGLLIDRVCHIVDNVSFKGLLEPSQMETPEGWAVQDADRLDIYGAVGLARVFYYFGGKGNPLHDPNYVPNRAATFAEYGPMRSPAFAHFEEKVIHLPNLMYTDYAKGIAAKRTPFVMEFIRRFLGEWNGCDFIGE